MILSQEDSALFFKLWMPLLRFASETHHLHVGKLMKSDGGMNLSATYEVASAIWEDVSIIDDYLARFPEISKEDRNIILNWKHAVHGCFALERHLSGGSIFISVENGEVYLVKGIVSSWPELFEEDLLPVILTTTLLPFKDVIITDGLFSLSNVAVGPVIRQDLRNLYIQARKSHSVKKVAL